MAESFSRKPIAKAFFGLDISDAGPSSTLGSRRPKKSSKAERSTKTKQESLLFTLPAEIRLEIYDLLLVSRFNRWDNPSESVDDTYQRKIFLDPDELQRYNTLHPAVLRACKQIYLEAVPILYSRNVFRFNHPDLMSRFIAQIGLTNTKLIQSLDIYVPPRTDKGLWLSLLHLLPETTVGLKRVVVRWWGEGLDKPWEGSLGKDVAFAQALAGLSKVGVQKLRIEGYYAKPWPAYLRDKLGARVVEDEDGRPHGDLPKDNDDHLLRKLYEETLEDFRRYQEGTEDLNPWEDGAAVSQNSSR